MKWVLSWSKELEMLIYNLFIVIIIGENKISEDEDSLNKAISYFQ